MTTSIDEFSIDWNIRIVFRHKRGRFAGFHLPYQWSAQIA